MAQDVLIWRKGTDLSDGTSKDGILFQVLKDTGQMEVVVSEVKPGAVMSDRYKHLGEEVHVVLSGDVEFEVDGKKHRLGEGDILWHDSSLPHAPSNPGSSKAVYLSIISRPTG